MALRKKGSRVITVDDIKYRWVVATDKKGLHFVAEYADEPGQRIVVAFHREDQNGEATSVTPADVQSLIKIALQKGWKPQKKAHQLHLGQGEKILERV
ncbi:hypothetical protein [Candidatus Uabimicrobium sp. HlEnr_7]|uniref:hypothetical protein n=1 Tax=Candidatus Uabimicrobium helgolandensis TaxID=3095367 RepID=UPI0035562657